MTGKAIATVGIWMGVGLVSFSAPESATGVSVFAMWATLFVWLFG